MDRSIRRKRAICAKRQEAVGRGSLRSLTRYVFCSHQSRPIRGRPDGWAMRKEGVEDAMGHAFT
jgi:hypothetical protein